MTDFSNPRRNPNDIMTDDIALGPHKSTPPISTMEGTYNKPGLPKPPGGYGRVLPTDEESMEPLYPDLYDHDDDEIKITTSGTYKSSGTHG